MGRSWTRNTLDCAVLVRLLGDIERLIRYPLRPIDVLRSIIAHT